MLSIRGTAGKEQAPSHRLRQPSATSHSYPSELARQKARSARNSGIDAGRSWKVTGVDFRESLGGRYAIHPAVAQLGNGSMVAFLRGPDPMPLLISRDTGESWEAGKTPFGSIGVGQKAAAMRLAGGTLLLCATDAHKPPRTRRRGAFVALSDDGGRTWSHVRALNGVGGYLSVAQASNGTIYVFGSRMCCAAFNETWLREGRPIDQRTDQ